MRLAHALHPGALFAALFVLAGCATTPTPSPSAWPWSPARQMLVVTSAGFDATRGQLRRFERARDGDWRQVGAMQPVMLGRAGIGWGLGLHPAQAQGPQKREGDGRNPAGVFAIGEAFGYARNARSGLRYRQMLASNYCMDVNGSPLYNQIVDSREVGEETVKDSTEPMRLDIHKNGDQRYKLGFVIEHNADAQPGGGSCIFAHLWDAPEVPTAGCTAMGEGRMHELLDWLDPQLRPVFVLLPAHEHARLREAWDLPAAAP